MVSALTAITPITQSAIFATRRADSACHSDNTLVGLMNLDVAGGQLTNAAKYTAGIAKQSTNVIASDIVSAEKAIKKLSDTNKFVKGVGKVLEVTGDYVNPVICLTSGVKVLTSDDKTDSAIKEGSAIGCMFASEATAKAVLGTPKTVKFDAETMKETEKGLECTKNGSTKLIAEKGKYNFINNNKVIIEREGLYKKSPFITKQLSAINDYCATKNVLKHAPKVTKALAFVGASIGGYKGGLAIGKAITGSDKKSSLKSKEVEQQDNNMV